MTIKKEVFAVAKNVSIKEVPPIKGKVKIDNVLIEEKIKDNEVMFGSHKIEVKPLTFKRLKNAKTLFQEVAGEVINKALSMRDLTLKGEDVDEANAVLDAIGSIGDFIELLGDKVPELFMLFVPGLTVEVFEDEENGPSLPDLIGAASVIARVNGFDKIPNILGQVTRIR
jgi:hypothetical protein